MQCYRHPKEETLLCCSKCERPICPRCTNLGPVGARCPDCATLRSTPLFQVSADRMVLGALAGFAASFLVGCVLVFLFGLGFFLLWGGVIGGGLVGEAVLRALGRKRGMKVEVLTGISTALGLAASFTGWYLLMFRSPETDTVTLLAFLQGNPFYLIAAIATLFTAVSRVRFF
jgi:hypothetical protein